MPYKRLAIFALALLGGLSLIFTPARSQNEDVRFVVEIPIEGTIEMGLAPFVERALTEAEERNADAVLLRIDTFGGRIDAAVRIRDAILDSRIPTIAWVEGRAISAGALITLAAETVIFSEGASIGAAQPVELSPGGAKETGEKTVSYMRGEMRATAEARGRDPHIAEAMVDEDIEIEGVIESGKLLTMTAAEAEEWGLVDHRVKNLDELRACLGWEHTRIEAVEPTWSELLVRFLTHPVLAGLLLSLGGLGLLLEMRSPGFGVPGLVGVICLALYFGSHYLVNLAGNIEIFLFLAGIILIVLEVFVIPGFGLAGILGTISLIMGVVLSRLVPHGGPGDLTSALGVLLGSFALTLLLFIVLLRYLPAAQWMHGIVLNESQRHEEGFHADQHEDLHLLKKKGRAFTDLRPAGTIEIGGKRYDAITPGTYIDKGTSIRVVEVEANRIVVETAAQESSEEKDQA
jgi:membrane-bound serine protease (ClpP class)